MASFALAAAQLIGALGAAAFVGFIGVCIGWLDR